MLGSAFASLGSSTCSSRWRWASLTTIARGHSLRARGTSRLIHQLGSVPGANRTRVWSPRRRLRATKRLRLRWWGQGALPS